MDRASLIEIHDRVNPEDDASYESAADLVLDLRGVNKRLADLPQVGTRKNQSLAVLSALFYGLLSEDDYVGAALLAWGKNLFNPEPRAVKLVWGALENHRKILCMGGSGQGKTYNASARTLLRWCRDPEHTTVKLISTTGGHAKGNIFSTFVRLHKDSIIPLPGFTRDEYIGIKTNDMHSAIARVAIASGDSGTASLRGFHPLPRATPHPIFGPMSYSIAILDEAEDIPDGVWQGVDNLAATKNIQVFAATNPMRQNSDFGVRAEPLDGWGSFNREEDADWEGHQGWHVLRLDPKKSENVVERRRVYEGFMDYEGYLVYESKGINSPQYDCFGRGRYPVATWQTNVVPANILNTLVGTVNFIGMPENWASFDGGYALGGDAAMLTTGRYGLANAFTDKFGVTARFTPKWMAIADQQFEIERVVIDGQPNSILMGNNLIRIATEMHVRPEWFVMDKTGNSMGVYDYLRLQYGAILGVEWGEGATEMKIMEEDSKTAKEQFLGITSEMWFGFSLWAEYGNFKISPAMQTQKLFAQLGSRKYTYASKTLRLVESKADYKKNNREESPNEADSLIMAPQLFRTRSAGRPAMLPPPPPKPKISDWEKYFRPSEKELAVASDKPYQWVDA